MRLYRLLPKIHAGGRWIDDPNPEHHRYFAEAQIKHNNTIIDPFFNWEITSKEEENNEIREFFIDWFNRFNSIADADLDLTSAMFKARKWFNGWRSNFIIQEVIT